KMDSSGSYIYANYGVAREGGFCRMVVFFNSAGGDGIEGVVNTDGSIQKIAKVSSANSSAPLMGTSIYGSPSGVNWSGYEVLCTSQCNANGQPTVEGAKMSFRIPTVYAPSASQANINSCCVMSECVGVGVHEHGHGLLI